VTGLAIRQMINGQLHHSFPKFLNKDPSRRAFGDIVPIIVFVIKGGPQRQAQGLNLNLNRGRLPSHVAGGQVLRLHLTFKLTRGPTDFGKRSANGGT
jgi:hypothetical protein